MARRTKVEKLALETAIYEFADSMQPVGVRQVAYAMLAQGFIEKTESEFAGVGRICGAMREGGRMPWHWFEDNSREYSPAVQYGWAGASAYVNYQNRSLRDAVENAFDGRGYRRALWEKQPSYAEVWVEKKGLLGVISEVTSRWEVTLTAAAGQCSKTILHQAAQHMDSIMRAGRECHIFYFGDYDGAGMCISDSIEERINRYTTEGDVAFTHAGLSAGDIEKYDLPTRPSKKSGPGAKRFNDSRSVELDALAPDDLRLMVDGVIQSVFDFDVHAQVKQDELRDLETIAQARADFQNEYAELIAALGN